MNLPTVFEIKEAIDAMKVGATDIAISRSSNHYRVDCKGLDDAQRRRLVQTLTKRYKVATFEVQERSY